MHKLNPITVLICISVRRFPLSVYYLCFLFVHYLFVSFAHLHESWWFSLQFSWAFCAIWIEIFLWYIWWKYFPQSVCLFIWVMVIFILETCKHFPLRFIWFIESPECMISLHIWCLLFFMGCMFFLKVNFLIHLAYFDIKSRQFHLKAL